jgi:hypothetical protein
VINFKASANPALNELMYEVTNFVQSSVTAIDSSFKASANPMLKTLMYEAVNLVQLPKIRIFQVRLLVTCGMESIMRMELSNIGQVE